jgi:hypothetical protein
MPKIQGKRIGLALVFVAGFLLGWLVVGWWLWPVRWVNTDPWDLRPEFKKHYILMAAESYALNSNPELLKERFKGWPREDLAALLNELKRENPGDTLLSSRLDAIKSALNLLEPGVAQPTPVPQAPRKGPGILSALLVISCLLVLVVLGGLAFRLLKSQGLKVPIKFPRRSAKPSPAPKAQPVIEGEYREVLPLVQYSTKYTYGDIRFSELFPIESGSEYLGECGIDSAEVTMPGDPPRYGAFEVWLFDKSSGRTVTKCIAIPKADETMLAGLRAQSSGEVVKAEEGKSVRLETENLECKVTIKDAAFGDEGTFFTKLELSFEVYKRQTAER